MATTSQFDFLSLKDHLYDDYKWISRWGERMTNLQLVNALIGVVQYKDPVNSVAESSIWAVCMAYKYYAKDGTKMSDSDLIYTRTRGGIIGMYRSDIDNIKMLTIREILEKRDPGFWAFSNPNLQNQKPKAG